LILDEFIDSGIDDLAIDGVVKIFEEFRKHDHQSIYVISHRIDDFGQFSFDTVLKVIKENNISRVESFSV
jgi:Fe-S cluster assembly ATPase SufC